VITLAIETATPYQTVALLNDRNIMAFAECASDRSLTQSLLPTIDRVLQTSSLTVSDIEGLAVSMGPGSFTGLRVGLATMTAFRMARDLPLVGVSTLEGLAWSCGPVDLPLLCSVQIRSELVYWSLFQWQDHQVVCLKEEQMGELGEVCASLTEPTLVLGDGWVHNRGTLSVDSGQCIEVPPEALLPSAKGIGWAGVHLFKEGKYLPLGCTPNYIQPSYAEKKAPSHPS